MSTKPFIKVCRCVIAEDLTPTHHREAWAKLKSNSDFNVMKFTRAGSHLSGLRNRLVNGSVSQNKAQALNPCYTHVLMIDDDVSGFDNSTVSTLLSRQLPVVGMAYPWKRNPYVSHCGHWKTETPGVRGGNSILPNSGITRLDWVGAGFLLIEAWVFNSAAGGIEYPWFREELLDWGQKAETTGEDIGLCLALGRAGIPVHVEFTTCLTHKRN